MAESIQMTYFRKNIEPNQENLPYKLDYLNTENGTLWIVRNPRGKMEYSGPTQTSAIEYRDKRNKG